MIKWIECGYALRSGSGWGWGGVWWTLQWSQVRAEEIGACGRGWRVDSRAGEASERCLFGETHRTW